MLAINNSERPPLGLPNGRVRALLTLLVVGVIILQIVRNREVEALWAETLMIALAHYFTSRRFINLTPEVIRRLEAEGHIETEMHPLYLPRHSIRILLSLTFIGLAVYLFRSNRLFDPQTISLLAVVFAYLLGHMVRTVINWWTRGRQTMTLRGWEDLKAIVVLSVLALTAGAYVLDRADLVPNSLRNVALGMVLFYFGSR